MKRERLHLSQHQNIETYRHGDTRVFIAYSNGCSAMFCDRKELVRWLKVPKSIPMRQSLDSWLDSLEAADQERQEKKTVVSGTLDAQPLTDEPVMEGSGPNLSQELLATGFGPEVFQDEEDPVAGTKMVI